MHYHSTPPSTGNRYEHEVTTLLGIAVSRRQLADQLAVEYAGKCADLIAALPAECAEALRNQGKAEAWSGAAELLSAALAEKRREP